MRNAHCFAILATLSGLIAAPAALTGQWLNYVPAGTPLTRDGKPDLTAKAPRTPDGKPDLSGVWQVEPEPTGVIERLYGTSASSLVVGDDPRTRSRYFNNLFIDFKRGEEPITPEARKIAATKQQVDLPTANCLPASLPNVWFNFRPFKLFQTPVAIAIFAENDGYFRQIHTDGRKLPVDPIPSWQGYSTGHWDGDTLVVDTTGFNDMSWLDAAGHPHSEAMRVEERLHRRDFGHLDVQVAIEDPVMLTAKVTVKFTELLLPDSDILEYVCQEGERDHEALKPVRN